MVGKVIGRGCVLVRSLDVLPVAGTVVGGGTARGIVVRVAVAFGLVVAPEIMLVKDGIPAAVIVAVPGDGS